MLQSSSVEIGRAYQAIRLNIEEIYAFRQNADYEFYSSFVESEATGNKRGTTIKPKSRFGRYITTDNCKGVLENYFRSLIFVPYLDHFITQVGSRFVQVDKSAVEALTLVPSNMDLPLPDINKDVLFCFW